MNKLMISVLNTADRMTVNEVVKVFRKGTKISKIWKLAVLVAMLSRCGNAEEESILNGAIVSETNLSDAEFYKPADLVGRGFKNHVVYYAPGDEEGTATFYILLDQTTTVHTMMLVNSCNVEHEAYGLGSAEVFVGHYYGFQDLFVENATGLSRENRVVAKGIVDGGFHKFEPLVPGNVVMLRRKGQNPFHLNSALTLNEIRLYETANLLQEQAGKVSVTAETSRSLPGFEAINLL